MKSAVRFRVTLLATGTVVTSSMFNAGHIFAKQPAHQVNRSGREPYAHVYIHDTHVTSKLRRYSYPQLRGLPDTKVQSILNRRLRALGMPHPYLRHDTMSSSYSLLMSRGAFMELLLQSYDFPKGAAHGTPSRRVVMMNLATGSIFSIKDLFKPNVDYVKGLSAGVRADDTQHVLDSFQKFTGVNPKQDGLYLSGTGVTVFFSPYEWTPYSMGFPSFNVPLRRLSRLINRQGELWRTFHSSVALQDAQVEQEDLNKMKSLGFLPLSGQFAQTGTAVGQYLYAWVGESMAKPGGSVEKVFFFLGNQYLGTDTSRSHGPVLGLIPTGDGTLSATYATGLKEITIHYHWTGKGLHQTP